LNTLGNVEPIVKSSLKDLYALLKPRVMWLAVFTAAVGIMIAPNQNSFFLSLIILLWTLRRSLRRELLSWKKVS
jgi:heme O synthase-like polyprenyltransferase